MRKKIMVFAAFFAAALILFSSAGYAGIHAYADSEPAEASFDKPEYFRTTEAGNMAVIYDEAELMTEGEELELG